MSVEWKDTHLSSPTIAKKQKRGDKNSDKGNIKPTQVKTKEMHMAMNSGIIVELSVLLHVHVLLCDNLFSFSLE